MKTAGTQGTRASPLGAPVLLQSVGAGQAAAASAWASLQILPHYRPVRRYFLSRQELCWKKEPN